MYTRVLGLTISALILAYGAVGAIWISSGGDPRAGVPVPPQAAAVGYNLNTLHTAAFTTLNVDMSDTGNAGFQWYLKNPAGWADTPASQVVLNGDGSMSLTGMVNSAWGHGAGWHGIGFGGGAYFEATLSWDPNLVNAIQPSKGWPAFWASPLEHWVVGTTDLWPGQGSTFEHFAEWDFMEYVPYYGQFAQSPSLWLTVYYGTTIDWSGTWSASNPNGYPGYNSNAAYNGTSFANYGIQVPAGTDFNQPHKFGYLWVPATATTQGYAQYYFDGVATADKVTWSKYDCVNPPAPPAANQPWVFGIMDCQHAGIIMNSVAGIPMRIFNVNVWQASTAGNLTN